VKRWPLIWRLKRKAMGLWHRDKGKSPVVYLRVLFCCVVIAAAASIEVHGYVRKPCILMAFGWHMCAAFCEVYKYFRDS